MTRRESFDRRMNGAPVDPEFLRTIEKIDPKAAEYVLFEARQLRTFAPRAGSVAGLFIWADTPQGHDYWSGIHDQAEEAWGAGK